MNILFIFVFNIYGYSVSINYQILLSAKMKIIRAIYSTSINLHTLKKYMLKRDSFLFLVLGAYTHLSFCLISVFEKYHTYSNHTLILCLMILKHINTPQKIVLNFISAIEKRCENNKQEFCNKKNIILI